MRKGLYKMCNILKSLDLYNIGLWCKCSFAMSMSPCCQCLLKFMLVLNDFVIVETILARVQLILSWF
jgi:hypothetical protein